MNFEEEGKLLSKQLKHRSLIAYISGRFYFILPDRKKQYEIPG